MTLALNIGIAWLAFVAAPTAGSAALVQEASPEVPQVGLVPQDGPEAPQDGIDMPEARREPLIVTPSTVQDFDPGFVEPPVSNGEAQPATASNRDAEGSSADELMRRYEAEIQRLEAMFAKSLEEAR